MNKYVEKKDVLYEGVLRVEEGNVKPNNPNVEMIELGEMFPIDEESKEGTLIVNGINPLHFVKTKLNVVVGELEISLGELLSAKEHQVFQLRTGLTHSIDLTLEGHVVARGQLVAVDGNFAIRITELPVSLKT